MIKRLPLFFLCALAIFSSKLNAQDPVFSQFYAAPLHINPAFAGVTEAPRFTFNYRNQWSAWPNAYSTYAAAYEQTIESLNSGFGFIVMADNAGDGIYKTNRFSAVYGYRLQASDNLFFKFGAEAGLIQTSINWDKLVFGDQLDPINGPTDPTNEDRPESLSRTAVDISAGLLVYAKNIYGGVSLKHLNSPNENFLQLNENLNAGAPMRLTIHAGMEFALGKRNNRNDAAFISPNVMFIKQGPFGQFNIGSYAGFGKFYGGLWYRHTLSNADAAIMMLGFRHGILRMGYSYDITLSELASAPGGTGGTHEIALTINLDDSRALQRKKRAARYSNCFKMFN